MRATAIAAQEAELAELKRKVERFPAELATAVKNAEGTTKSAVLRDIEAQRTLREKEIEGETKVLELKIASLQDVVAKQAAQIEALSKQLTAATAQVQQIAVKAIEGASGLRTFATLNEMANEQARKAAQK